MSVEATLYLALYIILTVFVGLGQALLYILSCGKGCFKKKSGEERDSSWDLYQFYGKRVGIYFMFLSGMIMNLLRPWNPPMLLYRSYVPLIGPDGKWERRSPRDIAAKDCTCCCFICCDCEKVVDYCCQNTCGCTDHVNDGSEKEFFGTQLPMWQTLRIHLLTVGGVGCIFGSSVTHDCCPQCCKFSEDIESVRRRVHSDRENDTKSFYNREYGNDVNCFEDLLAIHGANGGFSSQYSAPSAPLVGVRNNSNKDQRVVTGRIIQGVPVSASAVQVEAIPLNGKH